VQVGDPFMEKLLLEACLEVMATDACVGVQDMGAAGLTCATSETGSRGGVGVEIDVARVPQRETGMTPYEIMLSESQERMLLIVKRGREQEVERISTSGICTRSRSAASPTTGGCGFATTAAGRRGAQSRADRRSAAVPRPFAEPRAVRSCTQIPRALLAATPKPADAFVRLLRIADDREQALDLSPVRSHGADQHDCAAGATAGVVRIKGTSRALAMSVDGNGRFAALDPRRARSWRWPKPRATSPAREPCRLARPTV
jgi:phosphoribosylformylglycinamidine synthase